MRRQRERLRGSRARLDWVRFVCVCVCARVIVCVHIPVAACIRPEHPSECAHPSVRPS